MILSFGTKAGSPLSLDKLFYRDARDAILSILEVIGTPYALYVWLNLEYNYSIVDAPTPFNYLDADSYRQDAQAAALVRKNPWILRTNKFALEATTLGKRLRTEDVNRLTNLRLKSEPDNRLMSQILWDARRFASDILAHSTSVIGEPLFVFSSFGPGATTHHSNERVNVIDKLESLPHCTSAAWYAVTWHVLNDMPHYALECGILERDSNSARYVPREFVAPNHDIYFTVPKDCRGYRVCCKGAPGNLLYQKALGDSIRSALKKFGVPLNILPELHSWYAKFASSSEDFATLDLSSASDSITTELVRKLLPPRWFDILNQARHKSTLYPSHHCGGQDIVVENELFSSMGNGFTFELETLLFSCLAWSVEKHFGIKGRVTTVFGDDIICPQRISPLLQQVLSYCGFSLNKEKSFSSGPFRESCGSDYFDRVDVRPHFIKELTNDIAYATVEMCNHIRRVANVLGGFIYCDKRLKRLWLQWVHRIPRKHQFYGPGYVIQEPGIVLSSGQELQLPIKSPVNTHLLDLSANSHIAGFKWLISSPDEYKTSVSYRYGIQQIRCYSKGWKRRRRLSESRYSLGCILYGVPSSGVIPRGSTWYRKSIVHRGPIIDHFNLCWF